MQCIKGVLSAAALVLCSAGVVALAPSRLGAAPSPADKDVIVVNAPAQPVPVEDATVLGERWQRLAFTDFQPGDSRKTASFNVPAGKRLVIEHASAFVGLTPSHGVALAQFDTTVSGIARPHFFVMQQQAASWWVGSQALRLVHDGPAPVEFTMVILPGGSGFSTTAQVSLSGYLVDLP
jgi:hypothetical protein